MKYSMQYERTVRDFNKRKEKHLREMLWLILAVILCLQWFNCLDISLLELIVPGDMEVTLPAISRLVEALAAGNPISDSVSAFCYDVFQTM